MSGKNIVKSTMPIIFGILGILFFLTGCEDTPTISLTATPEFISEGGSTTLSWSSTRVTNCTASGDWSGSKETSGTETLSSITKDSTFNLSCTGTGGSVNDSVSVTIDTEPTPTVNLSADPVSVTYNGSTILTWDSSNADNCMASGDWSGSKDVSGTETINSLTLDSQFILSCSDANGSVDISVDVTIATSGSATALLSWTPLTQNTDGSALTDLVGYRIRYGITSGNYTKTITINNPGLTSYQIDNLTPADWYFVIYSVNHQGQKASIPM